MPNASYKGAPDLMRVPAWISLYCEGCKKDTFWETDFYSNETNKDGEFSRKTYKCRNCGTSSTIYYFFWKEGLFFKVGQFPELEERVSPTLIEALDAVDLKMYKNALRLRNFGLGIAAVAYMRRVVENRMNDMLQVLYEAALAHNASAELLAKHETLAKDKRFAAKVDYAGCSQV